VRRVSLAASPKVSHPLRTLEGVRILHTSDWHLGRLFHRASLLDEQALAMSRLVEVVQREGVELVLISGDLYDRSVPPAGAVELFDRTLAQLHASGATVVAISGNHDSAVRVGFGDQLLGRVGVNLRGDPQRCGQAVVVPASDGGPDVRVYPVPYLDPLATAHLARRDTPEPAEAADLAADRTPGRARFTHHDAMAWAMARVRADLESAGTARSVVVAHTFLTGGEPSASERELTMGHVEQVGMSVFDGIDYVALGHLHRRQAFDGGRVAYSGTPLRYSFSEQSNIPSVRLVDLAPDGSIACQQIELGVGRSMCTISGELEDLLADPALVDAQGAWVRAVLTDRHLPLQAMRRLQGRFPYAVELSHAPSGALAAQDGAGTGARVRAADPLELAVEFLQDRRGLVPDAAEQQLLEEAVAAVRSGSPA
jgi:DNA repair protein SbcD/Mre11